MKPGPAPVWTREEIIVALMDATVELGRTPTKAEWQKAEPGRPTTSQVMRRFGTWNRALRAAKLPTRVRGSHGRDSQLWWNRRRIIAAIQLHKMANGRPPRKAEWENAAPHHPCARGVQLVFGSWTAAINAAGYENPSDSWPEGWRERRAEARAA